jgi:hypothetical protein
MSKTSKRPISEARGQKGAVSVPRLLSAGHWQRLDYLGCREHFQRVSKMGIVQDISPIPGHVYFYVLQGSSHPDYQGTLAQCLLKADVYGNATKRLVP